MKYDRIEKKRLAYIEKENKLNALAKIYAESNSLAEFFIKADLQHLLPKHRWMSGFWWYYHLQNDTLRRVWLFSACTIGIILIPIIWLHPAVILIEILQLIMHVMFYQIFKIIILETKDLENRIYKFSYHIHKLS